MPRLNVAQGNQAIWMLSAGASQRHVALVSLALEGKPSQVKTMTYGRLFLPIQYKKLWKEIPSNYMLKKLEGKSFLFDDQKIWKGYPSIFMTKNLEGKSFQKIKYILEGTSFHIL